MTRSHDDTSTGLGIDPGNGAIKLWGPHGGLQLPALVAADGQRQRTISRAAGLALSRAPLHVQTTAGAFYLGPGAHDWGRPAENMDHERFTGTPELRALVYGAVSQYLALAEQNELRLAVTLGLPLETLSGADETVRATVNATKRWLEGEHAWTANDIPQAVQIEQCAITSQPVGAMFDYLLADDGQFVPARRAHFRAEIGVISIGMNTVELLVTRGGQVVPADTHAERRGVRRLLELNNPDGLYSIGELDSQLRAGKLDVSTTLPIWNAEVWGFLERHWGAKWRRFAAVLLVGGGMQLVGKKLSAHLAGKAILSDEPVLATARGLYKQALLRAQR